MYFAAVPALAPLPLMGRGRGWGGTGPAIAAAILLVVAQAIPGTAQPADTIITNAKVVTLDQRSTIAEGIAIRGERILAVGTAVDVRALAGPSTARIDVEGRTIIPGLIDSHIHAIRAGHRAATEVSWVGLPTLKLAIEKVAAAAREKPPGTWIVIGGGWTPGQFEERRRPTLAEIDAASPNAPVYIQLFYRAVMLNTVGTRRFSFDDDGQVAAVGFMRDDKLAGWFTGDSRAVTELFDRLPAPQLADSERGTYAYLATLAGLGVTGVLDPGGHNIHLRDYAAVKNLAREKSLPVRVVYSLSAPFRGSAPDDFKFMLASTSMQRAPSALVRFNGIGERVTWGLFNNDNPSDADKREFLEAARWAAERGLTLTVHWNNDRSVHHVLEIFEQVNAEHPIRDLRWSIAHLHDATPATLTRMKALGVGWLVQNGLYFATPAFLAQRAARINVSPPIKTALAMGVRVGAGTDANRVMDHNPFLSLRWMTDGRTVEGLPTRAAPELLTREEALRLYTGGSAWFTFDELERGTLEAGRLADLAVLSADYLTIPAAELPALRSVLTFVGGRVVHRNLPQGGHTWSGPDWSGRF